MNRLRRKCANYNGWDSSINESYWIEVGDVSFFTGEQCHFLALKKECDQTESFWGWATISFHGHDMNIQPSLHIFWEVYTYTHRAVTSWALTTYLTLRYIVTSLLFRCFMCRFTLLCKRRWSANSLTLQGSCISIIMIDTLVYASRYDIELLYLGRSDRISTNNHEPLRSPSTRPKTLLKSVATRCNPRHTKSKHQDSNSILVIEQRTKAWYPIQQAAWWHQRSRNQHTSQSRWRL